MNASPSITTGTAAPRTPATRSRLMVDAPTRAFHWLFALCFLGAYLTADGERFRLLHVTLGYSMAGLLAFRVAYGLLGPSHVGLKLLWKKVAGAPAWLGTVFSATRHTSPQNTVNWRQGQNLLMAVAVLALLVLVMPLTLSGHAVYNEWGDSLTGVTALLGDEWLEEVHEWMGNTFLAVVLGHLGLIAALSALRQKNQAQTMLTGRTEGVGPDLVRRNPRWLAAVLLISVVGYWAWEWQQSPSGLLGTDIGIQAVESH